MLLRAKNIHKTYRMGRAEVKVLCGTSIAVAKGEFVVIRGSSGSGKSTLLHILGALDAPDRGSVEFEGLNVFGEGLVSFCREQYRNRDVGFVFQFYHLFPELTVLENVMIPRLVSHSGWGWLASRRAVRKDAREMLERVGLSHRIKHRPSELSGGERQRVAISRALINRPALLLADEPTGNLDDAIGTDILQLLVEFNEAGQTIVMVTHDAKVAARASRQVRLVEGQIRQETEHRSGRRSEGAVV